MKKTILTALLLLAIVATNAQTHIYKATHINVVTQGVENGWIESDVTITWNSDTQRIYINSTDPQLIDYVFDRLEEQDGSKHYIFKGTDTFYRGISIIYTIDRNYNIFISIVYPEYYYIYRVFLTSK